MFRYNGEVNVKGFCYGGWGLSFFFFFFGFSTILPYEDLHFRKRIFIDTFSFLHHPVHATTILHGPAPLTGSNTNRQNDFIGTPVKRYLHLGADPKQAVSVCGSCESFLLLVVFGNYTSTIMSILNYPYLLALIDQTHQNCVNNNVMELRLCKDCLLKSCVGKWENRRGLRIELW